MEPVTANYQKAQKRVRQIRGFYTHIVVFLVVTLIMYLTKASTMSLIIEKSDIHEIGFENYLHWQYWTITISWVAVLLIQGIKLYGRPLISKWEQRKIQEFMDQDNTQGQNNNPQSLKK
nr:2TM domain-containing protein [Allomuricauda sp.]